MTIKRVNELTALTGAGSANDDDIVVFDTSANETKRISRSQLGIGIVGDLPFTPTGIVSATTLQAAVAELANEAGTGSGDMLKSENLSGLANYTTARANLGLTIGTNVQAYSANLTAFAGVAPSANMLTYLASADFAAMRTNLSLGSLATLSSINNGNWSGTALAIGNGGTGATTAADARSNLGVGTLDSPQFAGINIGDAADTTVTRVSAGNIAVEGNYIYRAGGTDVPITDGGTGASDAATARTNLGLGTLATLSAINNGNWSGTDLAVANGGTGASDAATARTNLGLGSLATLSTVNDSNWSGTDLALANGGTGASLSDPGYDAYMMWDDSAGSVAFVEVNHGTRNAIINGDFNIWQRGTSFTSPATGAYTADRWRYDKGGAMVHDVSRSTDVPTVAQAGRLFNYSILVDCTTVDSSISATDFCLLAQAIEGFNWLPLAQRTVVVSFWVKATKTGTYCVALRNSGFDRAYVAEYVVNASDTWEYKTASFTASPSAGTWDYTTGAGAWLSFTLACGSTYQTTANSWQTGNYVATSNQVNACDSTSNNFRLCGVQFEVGSVPTPFAARTFHEEFMLCLRYFQQSYPYGTYAGAVTEDGQINQPAYIYSNDFNIFCVHFPVRMRAAPTVTIYAPDGTASRAYIIGPAANTSVTTTARNITHKGFNGLSFSGSSGGASASPISYHYVAASEL